MRDKVELFNQLVTYPIIDSGRTRRRIIVVSPTLRKR
jgi:hypothetical protein